MKAFVFQNKGQGSHALLLVSTLILIVVTSFAFFTLRSNYILYPFWAIWLLCIVSNTGALTKNEKSYVGISILYLALVFMYWLFGFSKMPTLGFLVEYNWIMAGVVSVYALKMFSSKELSVTYTTLAVSLVILLLYFISEGREFIVSGDVYEAANIANAWYGSLYMLISGLSLIVLLNVRKLSVRLMAITALFVSLYLNVGVLQRGTNVVMVMAELSLILLFLIKRKSVVISLSVVIAAFIFIAFSSDNMVHFFDWLAQATPSERLAKRFDEIAMAIAFDSVDAGGGSFASRGELMSISWNTFTSSFGHFLFGVGEHAGNNTIIGHHSFLLDSLARYGIIGGVILFIYFKKQYQIFMSSMDRHREWALYMQCSVVFGFYILRNFYGELTHSLVNFALLLFFPLTFQIIHYYNSNSKKFIK